ncbi:MAG: CapA family protein [Thermodesulfobacteriota bacterium]|nr:CapA family protein [Thermodesulfobacteriota bacterium]
MVRLDELKRLQEDIGRVKTQSDVVILSLHWGVHHLPKVIATYQPQVAHAAIDAGADLILGHHAHILKAVEVYKGKVCFYSIGNFMTSGSHSRRISFEWNLYWWNTEPDYMYGFSVESKKTMLAKVVLSRKGVERVSFLPTFINKQAQPEVLNRNDDRFREILDYMEWVSDQFPQGSRRRGTK